MEMEVLWKFVSSHTRAVVLSFTLAHADKRGLHTKRFHTRRRLLGGHLADANRLSKRVVGARHARLIRHLPVDWKWFAAHGASRDAGFELPQDALRMKRVVTVCGQEGAQLKLDAFFAVFRRVPN